MTDDLRELNRRLEEITARQDAPGAMTPEDADLRAAWQTFGGLLEQAQPRRGPSLPRLPPLPDRRHVRWLAAAAALGASVLIAVTIAWHLRGTKPAPTAPKIAPQVAGGQRKPPASPVRQAPAAADTEIAWDDSLDQEIESAGRAILQVEQDQLASAAGPGRVQYHLEVLKKEMEEGPL